MLLDILGTSLLEKMLPDRWIVRTAYETNRKKNLRAGENYDC